jgi:hypothetical protein
MNEGPAALRTTLRSAADAATINEAINASKSSAAIKAMVVMP